MDVGIIRYFARGFYDIPRRDPMTLAVSGQRFSAAVTAGPDTVVKLAVLPRRRAVGQFLMLRRRHHVLDQPT